MQQDADHVADRIRARLTDPLDISELTIHITASIGIAKTNEGFSSSKELIYAADQRMYSQKRAQSGPMSGG